MAGAAKMFKAMVGTGLTFAAGVCATVLAIGTATVVFANNTFEETFRIAGRMTVVSFILGVAFSGMIAVASRSGRLARLTLGRVAGFGASAGLLYFLLIAMNAYKAWSPQTALLNFVLLTVLGAGAATGTLLLARRGRGDFKTDMNNSLESEDETRALNQGLGHTTMFSTEEVAQKKQETR